MHLMCGHRQATGMATDLRCRHRQATGVTTNTHGHWQTSKVQATHLKTDSTKQCTCSYWFTISINVQDCEENKQEREVLNTETLQWSTASGSPEAVCFPQMTTCGGCILKNGVKVKSLFHSNVHGCIEIRPQTFFM